jgi:hypothetical protein
MTAPSKITVNADDYAALRGIENAFNRAIWRHADHDPRHYQAFEQNLGLRGRAALAYYTMRLEFELARGGHRNPERKMQCLARAFDAMLPSLHKTFGEAAVTASLPAEAGTARMAEVCEAVGAHRLAGLCRSLQAGR